MPDDYWDTFIQKNEIADDILADFLTTAKNTDKNLEGYKQHLKNLSLSTSLFSQATTTATRMVKGLIATFTNMVILAAVVAGIQLLAKAIDNLNHTYDELKEEVQSSTEEFKNLKSELSTLESQLKTNEDRIKELNSLPHLKLIEQEELDRLKESNDELREQIYLKGLDVEKANRESQDDAIKFLSKEENYSAVSGFDNYGIATFEQNEGNTVDRVKWQIEEYERLIQLEKDLVSEKSKLEAEGADTEIIESELNIIDSQLKALEGRIPSLIKDIASMKASFVEGSTESATWLPQIEDLEDYYFDVFNVTFDNKDVQDKFDEVWNAVDFKKYRTELEEMARAGTLDASDLDGNENFQRLLEATGESAENLTEHIYATTEATDALNDALSKADPNNATQSDALTKLDSLKSGFKSLAEIYNSISVDKNLDMDLLDEDFVNTFSIAKEEFNDFIDIITNSPSDISACQGAFDNLVSAWLNSEDILSVLNDDTVKLIGTFLEEQGVVDATSWMMAELEARKLMAAGATDVLTNATVSEINVFFDELDASEETKEALARLELTKRLVNATTIDTSGDIANLIALAEQAGATARELSRAKSYEKVLNNLGKYGGSVSAEELEAEKAAAMKEFEYVSSFKPTTGSGSARNNGGGYTPKSTSTSSGGSSGSGSSSSDKAKQETIDWIERRNELLQKQHDITQKIADDESASYNERIEALKDLIAQDEHRAQIATESAKKYEEAWLEASKNLTNEDKQRIASGGTDIKTYDTQELLDKGIVDSLEAGEKYIDNLKESQEYYDLMIQYQEQSNDLDKEQIEHKKTILSLMKDEVNAQLDLNSALSGQVNSRMELMEAEGKYVGAGSYKELIRLSQEEEALHRDTLDVLYEELEAADDYSAEYYGILAEIEDCEDALIQCQVAQEEWNYKIARLPIDRIQMFRDLYSDIIEDMDNYRSIQDQLGLKPTKEELQQYIELYNEQIDSALKQQEELKNLQAKQSYGSDRYNEITNEIQELDNHINSTLVSMTELNNELLRIPLTEMAEEVDKLSVLKDKFKASIAEDNTNGLQTTIDQYTELNKLTVQQLEVLTKQRQAIVDVMAVYDEESQHYKDAQADLSAIDQTISDLVQEQYNWNSEILKMPVDKLESTNSNLQNYSDILGFVISEYDSALQGINALLDNETDKIQTQIDLLNEVNEARKISLSLEQAQWELNKAQNQKTTQVN